MWQMSFQREDSLAILGINFVFLIFLGWGGGHALSFLWVFFLGREASGRQYGISSALAVDLGEGEPFQLILSPSVSTKVTTWL